MLVVLEPERAVSENAGMEECACGMEFFETVHVRRITELERSHGRV